MTLDSQVRDEAYWAEIKQKAFPSLQPAVFYWAEVCPVLELASEAKMRASKRYYDRPRVSALLDEAEAARQNIASFVDANVNEVFFTTNATSALEYGLLLHNLKEGDEFIVTNHEHDTTLLNLYYAGVLFGVVTQRTENPDITRGFSDLVNEKTRGIIASYVTFDTGEILPWDEFAMLQNYHLQRDNQKISLIADAAQAVGHIPVNSAKLNADYITMSGHKWLLGPHGTGIAVIKDEGLIADPAFTLTAFAGDISAVPLSILEQLEDRAIDSFYEGNGMYFYDQMIGLSAAIDFHREVGDAMYDRILYLSGIVRTELQDMPRVRMVTPSEAPTGITSFEILGVDNQEASLELERLGTHVSYKSQFDGLRIATHYMNTIQEVEMLMDNIKTLIK